MDFLTKGQNSLEKMFNNIQLDTQEQIENLKKIIAIYAKNLKKIIK